VPSICKKLLMKKRFILFCIALITAAPICLGQASPSKSDKFPTKEAAVTDAEKSAWEAYKNKQADAFKKYFAPEYCGFYADGIKNVDNEVADMEKYELRDYSFADMKITFPSPNVAVTTYKVTLKSSSEGQDKSGTYNVGNVWITKGGKWLVIFHTEAKSQ
jgi:hypothetical protein